MLLFGSETWNLTPTLMKRLDDFHTQAAWWMAAKNKPHHEPDETWLYPLKEEVLEEVGLFSISHYVEVRR